MRESVDSAIAANRFGLGARPGDLGGIGRDPRGWLTAQLAGAAPILDDRGLRGSADILSEALAIRRARRQQRVGQPGQPDTATQAADALKLGQLYRPIYISEATARLRAAVMSERPFVERLTHFWTNHFAVSIDKAIVLGLAGSFEREAIRPHVLGNFTNLLLAVEQHPAMLLYLDNHLSVGPNSPLGTRVARRRPQARLGINENLAREIMELHTLGVNSGYTQTDVTTFAKVLSGWSIGGATGRLANGEPGRFMFRPELHEPGAQRVLGKRYPQEGFMQGETVLRDFALHPATAHHIAEKLARHFIADEPPPRAVEQLARTFLATGGDLPALYRTLVHEPESWARPLSKYKTPSDYVISTFRGLQLPVIEGRGALVGFEALGQRTYSPGSPAGWPDRAPDWDGGSALLRRVEWADELGQRLGAREDAQALAPQLLGATLGDATRAALAHASSPAQALTLLLAAPEFLRR
ncbi:MAG TPA: DUF1800 domain-containing protein [Steroidobacteraceae bacterium]|nr:DUF1800 domain-containing protein [Steroidobacteraceae bacterium]